MVEAKPFAAFDVDGTIFKSSLLEKVVEASIQAGIFSAEPFNKVYEARKKWQLDNNEGLYLAYLKRLVKTFIDRIEGVSIEQFERVTTSMIKEQTIRKFAFPKKLIRAVQASHHIVALSGSPDIVVGPFLSDLPIYKSYGSHFEVEGGIFTGKARSAGDKGEYLRFLIDGDVVSSVGSIAVGDTINDASMLEQADIPIMFNASRTLTEYGKEFGWTRVHEVKDQNTVLIYDGEIAKYVEQDVEVLIDQLRHQIQ